MGIHVLIVDDNDDFGSFVKEVCDGVGLRSRHWSDPVQFKQDYEKTLPEIVVVDIAMQPIDGMQLAQWMGELARTIGHSPSIIVVSGQRPDQIRLCSSVASLSGINRVVGLSKPVAVATLEEALLTQAEIHGLSVRARTQENS